MYNLDSSVDSWIPSLHRASFASPLALEHLQELNYYAYNFPHRIP